MKKKTLNLYEINENNVREIKDIHIDSWYENYNYQGLEIYDRETSRSIFIPKDSKLASFYRGPKDTHFL